MKEFRDFLEYIDHEDAINDPLLKALKSLEKKVSPLRKIHSTLEDIGHIICNQLDHGLLSYGRNNNPIIFTRLLIQYLADFDTRSQYFIVKSELYDWYGYRIILTSSLKGALTSFLTEDAFASIKNFGALSYVIKKIFVKNFRYPKIMFIVSPRHWVFKINLSSHPFMIV